MIVTIGRQHGSNGRDIARALAKEMGYACPTSFRCRTIWG